MPEARQAQVLHLDSAALADPDVSADVWVSRYAKVHNIRYSYKTNAALEEGEPIESGLLLSQLRLCAHSLGLMDVKRMLPDALAIWKRDQAHDFIASLRERMTHRPSADLVSDWVEAVTGSKNELDVAVGRHFVWQVKRKLFGLPVEHHLMPVLVGKSGGGKSVAVQKLIDPLTDVASYRDMTIFNDQFARRAFTRNFVIFFDELGRLENTDVNALKSIITAPRVEWRGMGSEASHSARQNATFIGCSNVALRERLRDPSSVRRFWELRCKDRVDWATVNSIDYTALWRSVDESSSCPLLPVIDEIRATQEATLRQRDHAERWLNAACEPRAFSDVSPTTDQLHRAFVGWCQAQGILDVDGLQTFARALPLRLMNLGWSATSKRSYRGTTWPLGSRSETTPNHDPGAVDP